MLVFCGCCFMSGSGLCDWLIPRPEESYRVSECVSLSVNRCNNSSILLQRVGRRSQNEKEKRKKLRKKLRNVCKLR
jgi:hypothetical protein